jgi:hypothetical protein
MLSFDESKKSNAHTNVENSIWDRFHLTLNMERPRSSVKDSTFVERRVESFVTFAKRRSGLFTIILQQVEANLELLPLRQ